MGGQEKLLAIAGQTDNEVFTNTLDTFDLETETWTTTIIPAGVARDHLAAVAMPSPTGDVVYLVGGKYGTFPTITSRVDIYDPLTNSFTSGPNLPVPLAGGTVIGVDDTIFYLCGAVSKTLSTFRTYSLDTSDPLATWQEGGQFYDSRGFVHAGGAFLNGMIYGAGGADIHTVWGQTEFSQCFAFDTNANSFMALPDMPLAGSHVDFTTVTVSASQVPGYAALVGNTDGFLLVGGPVRISGTSALGTERIFCYDITNASWSTLPVYLPMPMIGGAWSVVGETLYSIAGGVLGFDATTNAWKIELEDLFFRGAPTRYLHTYAPLSSASMNARTADNLWSPNDVYPLYGATIAADGMEFDGVDDRAFVPGFEVAVEGQPTDRFTLALMFNPDTVDNEGRLFAKSSGTGFGEQVLMVGLWPTDAGTVLRARVRTNGQTKTFIANAGFIAAGDWQGVVAIYDGAMFRMYLGNGETQTLTLAGEWPLTGNVEMNPDMFATLGNIPKGGRAYDGKLQHLLHLPGIALPPSLMIQYFRLYSPVL